MKSWLELFHSPDQPIRVRRQRDPDTGADWRGWTRKQHETTNQKGNNKLDLDMKRRSDHSHFANGAVLFLARVEIRALLCRDASLQN